MARDIPDATSHVVALILTRLSEPANIVIQALDLDQLTSCCDLSLMIPECHQGSELKTGVCL